MAKKTKNKYSDECEGFDENGNPLVDGLKHPIQLSSLITKLQAIMSKHGDLPVYACEVHDLLNPLDIRVDLKEEDGFTLFDRIDKVMIYV